MEEEKKKKTWKNVALIAGIAMLVTGLLIVIIPTFISRSFRLVKNNEDVTGLYAIEYSDEYLYTLKNDSEYFNESLNNNELLTLDLEKLYNDNNRVYVNNDARINFTFKVVFDSSYEGLIKDGYVITKSPTLKISAPNFEKTTQLNKDLMSFNYEEVDFTSLNTESLIVSYSDELVLTKDNDTKELSFNISYFEVMFFKEV